MLLKRVIWWTSVGFGITVSATLCVIGLLWEGFLELSALVIDVVPIHHAGP